MNDVVDLPKTALLPSTARESLNTEVGIYRSANAVVKEILPTVSISPEAREIFNSIIRSRAIETWLPYDIELATQAARIFLKYRQMTDRMEAEDPVAFTTKGTPVANPIYAITMNLAGTVQAITRTLGLSASLRDLTLGDDLKRAQEEAKMRESLARGEKHDLI